MPSLEKIVETIDVDECDPNFRLWCTSYPSSFFPVTILQNGVKMTNEPPTGLRANLLRSYMMDPLQDPKFFGSMNDHGETKLHMFRKISFALCFLHAILQERRNFGSLGWNIPYEFNASDLAISMQQLQIFLIQQKQTPWSMLTYTAGQCNYGGRVTDDTDRRLLLAILADYYTPEIGDDEYKLSESGLWYAPKDGDHQSYIDFIKGLPAEQKPEAFGLHENADISKDILNSFGLFSTALISATGGGGGGGARDDKLLGELSKGMADRLPPDFVTKLMQEKYPVNYHECMNTVLVQEAHRFNRLLAVIRPSLVNIEKATRGEVVMSTELERVANSLIINKVPDLWMSKSYPNRKNLFNYFNDLLQRLDMLEKWYQSGFCDIWRFTNNWEPFLKLTLSHYQCRWNSGMLLVSRFLLRTEFCDCRSTKLRAPQQVRYR